MRLFDEIVEMVALFFTPGAKIGPNGVFMAIFDGKMPITM